MGAWWPHGFEYRNTLLNENDDGEDSVDNNYRIIDLDVLAQCFSMGQKIGAGDTAV
jgi:hypothetical protein